MERLKKLGGTLRDRLGSSPNASSQSFSDRACIIEGWLMKRAVKSAKKWDLRYFILYDNALVYYVDEESTSPRGVMALTEDYYVSDSALMKFGFQVSNLDGTSYIFAADTLEEKLYWVHNIACAIRQLTMSRMPPGSEVDERDTAVYADLDEMVEEYSTIRASTLRASIADKPDVSQFMQPPPGILLNRNGKDSRSRSPNSAPKPNPNALSFLPMRETMTPLPDMSKLLATYQSKAAGTTSSQSRISSKRGSTKRGKMSAEEAFNAAMAGTGNVPEKQPQSLSTASKCPGSSIEVDDGIHVVSPAVMSNSALRNVEASECIPKVLPTEEPAGNSPSSPVVMPKVLPPEEPADNSPSSPVVTYDSGDVNYDPYISNTAASNLKSQVNPMAANRRGFSKSPEASHSEHISESELIESDLQRDRKCTSDNARLSGEIEDGAELTMSIDHTHPVKDISQQSITVESLPRSDETRASTLPDVPSSSEVLNGVHCTGVSDSQYACEEPGMSKNVHCPTQQHVLSSPTEESSDTTTNDSCVVAKDSTDSAVSGSNQSSSVVQRMANLWQKEANRHLDKQAANPFSSSHKTASAAPVRRGDNEYGKPVPGSATAERAASANAWVVKEIEKLVGVIERIGVKKDDGSVVVCFGPLFYAYQDISDTLVGIMMRAKKRNVISYPGDMLFQGCHDKVEIVLNPARDS